MSVAWNKGDIKIEINNSGEITRHESKKNEAPSMFLARILRTSKGFDGEHVWNYLKADMNSPVIRHDECRIYNKKTKKCRQPEFTGKSIKTKTFPCSKRRKEGSCPKMVERKQKIMQAQEDISGLIFCQQNYDFYGRTVFTIKDVRLVTELDALNVIKKIEGKRK